MSEFQKWWRVENDEKLENIKKTHILKQFNLTSSSSSVLSSTELPLSSSSTYKNFIQSTNKLHQIIRFPLRRITSIVVTTSKYAIVTLLLILTLTSQLLPSVSASSISLSETLPASSSASSITFYQKVPSNKFNFLNRKDTIVNETNDIESDYDTEDHTGNPHNNWISTGSLISLIIIYGIVVFGGVLGNASLVVTLCSQSSVRLRNPLLVALCIADLLVAGVSAPSTIVTLALTQKSWTLPSFGCKAIYFFQSVPVAASTISFLMLSLDRYASVKHPSLAQIRQRRYVHTMVATFSWIGAFAICIPILLAYRITSPSSATATTTTTAIAINSTTIITTPSSSTMSAAATIAATTKTTTDAAKHHISISSSNTLMSSSTYPSSPHQKIYMTCKPDYGSNELRTSFIIVHTVLVFIFPGLGVILNHFGVRRKLCALSLTARAAHGELPLPMPILRRPTHMIIVTGMANAARGVCSDESSEDEQQQNNDNDNKNGKVNRKDENEKGCGSGGVGNTTNGASGSKDCITVMVGEKNHNNVIEKIIKTTSPKSPRAMREIRLQQQRQKLLPYHHYHHHHHNHHHHHQSNTPAPELPLPQTSTLRARRRLANMLVAAAIIFIGCWTPHVFCVLWTEFSNQKQYCSKTISYFSLLLGYSHSTINPIIYWALNHNTLRQSPCAPFMRFEAIQRFFRAHLRSPAAPPPPSSTNEAALGAFNPRYIKTTPKQYRAQASSHYLY